ncbi:transmembrane protein, putative [Medicago truncatula]|uniref:Transmembrane protein, putative n=1 Tax=Medicago truncatula TaxID=3880 RepID=A0A072U3G8_MEDTR|nr:transmembrane protein, putative [Medicago truncatula]
MGARGTVHIEVRTSAQARETPHFTQNLKAMSLWVLLLIRCSTFTILSNVGHITHTCKPTLPLKRESITLTCSPRAEAFYFVCIAVAACTVVAAFYATDRRPRSHPSSNRGSDTTVGSRGERGGPSTSRLEQPHKQKRHHTLTQNLKAMDLWVLLLIRCSTFTILFNVEHITHTYKSTSKYSSVGDRHTFYI